MSQLAFPACPSTADTSYLYSKCYSFHEVSYSKYYRKQSCIDSLLLMANINCAIAILAEGICEVHPPAWRWGGEVRGPTPGNLFKNQYLNSDF